MYVTELRPKSEDIKGIPRQRWEVKVVKFVHIQGKAIFYGVDYCSLCSRWTKVLGFLFFFL